LSVQEIETLTGLKTYPMVANRKENRSKMIRIIADILDMSTEDSPLLAELYKSTEVSYETLFGLELESTQEDSLIVTEEPVLLKTTHIENKIDVSDTRRRIDQILSETIVVEPTFFKGAKVIEENLKIPVENALVSSDLYTDFMKTNSFTLNEKLGILFTAINCVFLTEIKPKIYPRFSSFLRSYKMDVFNTKEINIIRKYYTKILKNLKK